MPTTIANSPDTTQSSSLTIQVRVNNPTLTPALIPNTISNANINSQVSSPGLNIFYLITGVSVLVVAIIFYLIRKGTKKSS